MSVLTGKCVIVTGASRGIGAEAAKTFAENGAHVALLARNADAIHNLADEIGDLALPVTCDVSNYASLSEAVSKAEAQFGPTEVLINNAGVIDPIAHLSEADVDAWARAIDINLKGVFFGMRLVMAGMIKRGHGTILNVSSGAANGPVEGWSHYCSSKAGAAMLTRCGDKEARDAGVRVLGLSPGTVATEMQREIKASGVNPVSQLRWSDHIPADWPARALLWMCSPEADAYLGQDISLREEGIRQKVGLI